MRTITILIVLISVNWANAQFTIIPTGTSSPIFEIEKKGELVVINGSEGYLSKCYGECEELIDLTVVGDFGYRRSNLNLLDTNVFYMTSHNSFPYHGYVFKTIDGGLSWNAILDTSDILFSQFFMFDTLNGIVTSTFSNAILTKNDGLTWNNESHGLITISASLKINDSTAIMGVTEEISYTLDKGNSWNSMSFIKSAPMAFFAGNGDTVYVVSAGTTGDFLSFTPNLGVAVWENQDIMDDFIPRGLYVKKADEIYVTGEFITSETGGILKTTDLGLTWSFYDTNLNEVLYDIEFVNDSIALISGSNGLLLRWNSNSKFETVGINDLNKKSTIKIFPNPSNDHQNITFFQENSKEGSIKLIDINGRTVLDVFNGEFNQGDNSFSIDLTLLPNGIYFYKIQSEDKVAQEKIIKL